jgi:hypothetical protein
MSPGVSAALDDFHAWNAADGNKPALMLALGTDQTSDQWRAALYTARNRRRLIQSAQRFINDHNAIGVDIAWIGK